MQQMQNEKQQQQNRINTSLLCEIVLTLLGFNVIGLIPYNFEHLIGIYNLILKLLQYMYMQ